MRDAEEVDEEADGDGWADAVAQHVGAAAQHRREAAQPPAVAHLEELPRAHGARFPEAVGDPAVEREHDAQRRQQRVPEFKGEAVVVVDFGTCDEDRHGQVAHHAAGDEHVAPRAASGDEEV